MQKSKSKIVTRFPPSPTGYFHIGSARTALFNYLFAEHTGGTMSLRFEDTDKARNKKEYEDDIVSGLEWLGLTYTKPDIFRQSERTEIYRKYLRKLIESGAAYEAEAGTDDPAKNVIRFKNPGASVTFRDVIRGDVSFETAELKDFVIAKNIDEPLYNFAVVADDYEIGVTHVIRGEDHISNTPRQILMLEALGFPRPQYAHIPLILAPDRSKMSKRHGAVSLNEYRKMGFVSQALVNYLALLGWNPGGDREIFSLKEIAEIFTIEHIHKGGAIFDVEKLKWFNHEYIKRLSDDDYASRLRDFTDADAAALPIALIKERARTFVEAAELIKNGEFQFMSQNISYEPALLIKGAKTDVSVAKIHLSAVAKLLEGLSSEQFTSDEIKNSIFPYATKEGRGAVLWPLRVALSGREKSPDPFIIASLIGKERTLERITKAMELL
ncbi:MAG TPA: glutamate--tRNA ligase [Candidatus Paceibacterota bacterium]